MTDDPQQQTQEPGLLDATDGQVYVVQEAREVELSDGGQVWHDIATVTVPPRTRRATVLTTALEQAGIKEEDAGPIRVLDEESAEEWRQETWTNPQTVWRPGRSV